MKRAPGLVVLLTLVVTISLISSGCASAGSQHTEGKLELAPMADMPSDVQASAVSVQEAYRFAAANPDVLTQIPCYCGCGTMGHTSNYACYLSGETEDGDLAFDAHALGCSICVDITQDTMRLLSDGKSVPEIRTYVDKTYAQYGPSNMPAIMTKP